MTRKTIFLEGLDKPLTVRQVAERTGLDLTAARDTCSLLMRAKKIKAVGEVGELGMGRPEIIYAVADYLPRMPNKGSGQIAGPCMSRQYRWQPHYRITDF